MRILYIGINYWPDETGIAPFATGRCEYLRSRGHAVTVCTAMPYYPQWRVSADYRGRLWHREMHNGITILRAWLYVPRRARSFNRIVHEASFVVSGLLRALSISGERPDLILVTSPPLALALSAIVLSRAWRVPYVFHVADLQPDAALDLGMLRPGRLTHTLYRLEAAAYRHAAAVSTLNNCMRERIIAKGVASEKVKIFSDWTDPELFRLAATDGREARTPFLVAHFGNMGVKQGLDVIVRSAALTAESTDLRYMLVGDGSERSRLVSIASASNLPNVEILPLQPHERFVELLERSDLSLITQLRSVADIVFPSKVLTLMAAGKPIVAAVGRNSEIARVIGESGAGVVVAPEDPAAMAEAIVKLKADPAGCATMSARARQYALAHWERDAVLQQMELELIRIASARKTASGSVAPIRSSESEAL